MKNIVAANNKKTGSNIILSEEELINTLRNSLYPGAQNASIKLVISYCKASGLDPMQKPVHIVPMFDKKTRSFRDVIMPGIGSYRIQASRSGEYAGVSDPEFGSDIKENIGGETITYPSWCRVVVKRMLKNGVLAEFAATERWKENYATKSKDIVTPNAIWAKRPYAQLAKCAEAQALRKAFPEIGSQPTAEEMEGKTLNDSLINEKSEDLRAGKESNENCSALIAKCEEAALSGIDAFGNLWKSLTTEERQIIGNDEKDRIKNSIALDADYEEVP